MKLRAVAIGAAILVGTLLTSSRALAWGERWVSGGHPYHNGYLFVPPSSAYEAVRYRPPIWYGPPAYYYPESYLGPDFMSYYPQPDFPWVNMGRARYGGYFYMSHNAYLYAYPW